MNYSNNNTDSTLPSSSNNLTMFNLVFAFTNNNNNNNTHYNPNSKYSTTNTTTSSIPTNISKEMIDTALYKHILAKITAALKYEQVKRQYVRKEVETIMAVKEQCLNMWFDNNTATTGADASKTSGAFAGNGGGNGCGSTGASGSVGDQQNNAIAGAASNTASTSATTNLFLSTSNPTSSSITNNCSTTNNITSSNPPFLPTSTTSSNNSNNSKTNYSPHVEIRHRILAASSLARTMAHLFHAVTDNTMAHLVVNSSIDLALLPCFYEKPFAAVAGGGNTSGDKTDGEAMSGGGVMGGGGGSLVQSSVGTFASLKDEEGFLMRPYKALLLLYDPEEIVKGMPWDPSPLLVQLVQIVTPAIW